MKKIILILFSILLISIVIISLSSRSVKITTYPDKQTKMLSKQFTIIKEISLLNDAYCYYIYDNNTKIMYLYTQKGYGATMCPYYVIINGEPTIAIYGVNYKYQE